MWAAFIKIKDKWHLDETLIRKTRKDCKDITENEYYLMSRILNPNLVRFAKVRIEEVEK